MRIILVGASGTLGKAVHAALKVRHEVIRAGRKGADVAVDITDPKSIAAMYDQVGKFDAVACAAGKVTFAPLGEMTPDKFAVGNADKLMGQVNLVALGQSRIAEQGSFTLITGILSREPIRAGASAALVNGAIDAFVRAAAIELPRGIRINSVSPTVFVESMEGYGPFFRGFKPVPVAEAAEAYVKSIEGAHTGQTYVVG